MLRLMTKKEKLTSNNNLLENVAPYLGIGTQLAASILVAFFIGKWLDDVFKIFPVLTIILSLLGVAAGLYNFIKTILEIDKRKNIKN